MKRITIRPAVWGLLFISPWLIGFAWFQLYPLILSLYYSFTDYSIVREPRFVGLSNYVKIFTEDKDFFPSLRATFVYTLIAVPAKLAFALLVALILNMKGKFINLYRTVYYLPSILGGSVAISILWRFLFMREGIVNQALSFLHIPAVDWLGSPSVALWTISFLVVWQFGSSMVLFLAGLKQIPMDLYEAAMVDGGGRLRMFASITVPMLTPIILFNLVMQTIGALQEFTAAFVVTNGGPMKSTYLIGLKIYDDAFQSLKMGYASALSWVLFAIILMLTLIIFRSSKSWVHYEDGGRS
ncbi:oligogalacturonide transport system permease protein [Paenibacillus sp. UNCCL117]|uniref:carbohydrate ABC transporter permease n=1 Tax=unclassified Paenibacillus TaxID=185978 RepID=UPI0008910FA4|nr:MULTISPECIES: sugar ABC transporter permease [unclassified Paenibacillus]SDD48244.1 oligogalacturonide transport system permease protein [Paenibacillus sp. cl123]SFW50286.1 oligogalacturonide transport system permease protein [Paenibacillus sp. UNCCL117]